MKKTILSLLALALLCGAAMAEYMLTKDRTPGGLYVVGPDLSPDSVFGEYLYYSPDAGTTLVKKDSADYGFIEPEYSSIAADFTSGNLYKVQYGNFYHSDDYGATWEMRRHGIVGRDKVSVCRNPGELYLVDDLLLMSFDYAVTFDTITSVFIFHIPIIGWVSGELYGFLEHTGDILYSSDGGYTTDVVNNIGPDLYLRKTRIRRGHQEGEVYLLSADSLMRSTDHCSTFTRTNPLSLSFDDISPGNNPGELYASRSVWFFDPDSGFRGGHIKICFSEDYGETFACLSNSASGITFDTINSISEIPQKPEDISIGIYPNPFNTACKIRTEPNNLVAIYSLKGQIIMTGKSDSDGSLIWEPVDIPAGVYLIKSAGKLGKVTYIR